MLPICDWMPAFVACFTYLLIVGVSARLFLKCPFFRLLCRRSFLMDYTQLLYIFFFGIYKLRFIADPFFFFLIIY